jgi:methionine synthase II (cobalamin-independent)
MTSAPFRADHVGSLLRPVGLRAARGAFKSAAIGADELRRKEDDAIAKAIARQESIGLPSVTDGEMRRDYWHLDFVRQLEGIELTQNPGTGFANLEQQPPIARVAGKVRYTKPIMVDDFAFLTRMTTRTAKMTIPSPTILHLRGGRSAISNRAYPDLEAFWADTILAYRHVLQSFVQAGCTYLQLDDVGFSYLCDSAFREACIKNGDDPGALPRKYVDVINAVLEGRPKTLAVTMHTCRGNFRSSWVAQGGYEAVAETMFDAAIDGFFMEFDDARSGGFEPLRFVPKGKRVVLGLVTTKVGKIETKDELKRRIDQAARFVPIEDLCVSPQCGFSSTHEGNMLSEDDQWRKLELVVDVAREVWGAVR